MSSKIEKYKQKDHGYELICSKAETRIERHSLGEILNNLKEGIIIEGLSMQRDAEQWSKKEKSMLIHSVLVNLSILPVSLISKENKELILLDGKQRLSTFEQFKNNDFALSSKTPPVRMRRKVLQKDNEYITEEFDYKIAKKFYYELPSALQIQFNKYNNMFQYIHINYTPEEIQNQILRDNTSVKMTPEHIGSVLCGEELAMWLREIRLHDLFLNYTTWTSSQESRNLKERCIVEGLVLAFLGEQWSDNYMKNIELFKQNVDELILFSYNKLLDNLTKIIIKNPEITKYLTKNNLPIIIAAYKKFSDFNTKYEQDDFGKFLCKWFFEIKSDMDYEANGNKSSVQKTMSLCKLKIINKECKKYMKMYGHEVKHIAKI